MGRTPGRQSILEEPSIFKDPSILFVLTVEVRSRGWGLLPAVRMDVRNSPTHANPREVSGLGVFPSGQGSQI